MKLWILTTVAAVAVVDFATAQAPAQLPAQAPAAPRYSDGLPLLKRRPFAPGGEFTPPLPAPPGYDPCAPAPPVVRGPMCSPYSQIRYDWLPVRVIEKLPTPVPPVPGAPAPLPAGPVPNKPPVPPAPPADKKPFAGEAPRPTMLPTER